MITRASAVFLILIVWEALISHRPALATKVAASSLEYVHVMPPLAHSYNRTPSLAGLQDKLIKLWGS